MIGYSKWWTSWRRRSPTAPVGCIRNCSSSGNLKAAADLLKRAEQVSDCDVDRAITFNNLACYYRRYPGRSGGLGPIVDVRAIDRTYEV